MFSYTDTSAANFYDNRLNYSNAPSTTDAKTEVTNLEAAYVLGGGWSLTAVASHTRADLVRR